MASLTRGLFVLLMTLVTTPALAQGGRASVILKAGLNVERSEDGLRGESGAFGADLLIGLGDRWKLDAQLWLPAYFTTDSGVRHRDIIFAFGAQRSFGSSRVRPFLSMGFGMAHQQEHRQGFEDFGGTSGMLYAGGGVRIPINDRLAIVPEIRLSGGAAFGLVRPAVGIEWVFW